MCVHCMLRVCFELSQCRAVATENPTVYRCFTLCVLLTGGSFNRKLKPNRLMLSHRRYTGTV